MVDATFKEELLECQDRGHAIPFRRTASVGQAGGSVAEPSAISPLGISKGDFW